MNHQTEWTCKECDADNAVCGCNQEPVAWMYVNQDGECEEIGHALQHYEGKVMSDFTPLYTHPPIDPKAHMSVMVISAYEAGQYFMQEENTRLRTALMDAINKPKGVVPVSAEEFYDIRKF